MRIECYSFGSITIDGTRYNSDVLIYKDRVDDSWWRKEGHSLCVDDIREIIAAEPEVLVVGTGNSGLMRVPKETKEFVEGKGIEVIAQKTADAVKVYNSLCGTKDVVAALHLTC